VQLVKIPVKNCKATKFYRETLGLSREFAVEAYGWAQYKTGAVPLCLYVVAWVGVTGSPGATAAFTWRSGRKGLSRAVSERDPKAVGKLEASDDANVLYGHGPRRQQAQDHAEHKLAARQRKERPWALHTAYDGYALGATFR